MASVLVTLTPAQTTYAQQIAATRQRTAPPSQAHGCNGGLPEHTLGALGETAFSLWATGHLELTINIYRRHPDFRHTEVRTRSQPHWDLIIRHDDNPHLAYVLVVPAGENTWRLAGWIWGTEARNPEWLATHGGREPAWFIPQRHLHPMTTYPYRQPTWEDL